LGVTVVQITEDMYPPKWMTEQDAYAMMKLNLLAIAETCQENGVYIAVEQHGPYTAKIKSLTRILELVDSPWIRVNYDCGNTFLSGEDPYAMLEAVIDKVVHVHAKDISRKQAESERGKVTGTAVGCACGDGEIDWNRIVKRLKRAGYKGVLSVECGTQEEAKRIAPVGPSELKYYSSEGCYFNCTWPIPLTTSPIIQDCCFWLWTYLSTTSA
jgi:sugar phosphate isomerase/epimerase